MYFLGALVSITCLVSLINFAKRYRVSPAVGAMSLMALELAPEWIAVPSRFATVLGCLAFTPRDDRFVVLAVLFGMLPAREYTVASILGLMWWVLYTPSLACYRVIYCRR